MSTRTPRRPNTFIVGAPKCGTSSMRYYLDQHPNIFMAAGEPHFFGSDIKYNEEPLTKEEYFKFFGGARGEKIVGEKSTWYLYSENAAREIFNFNPNSKIIVQVRNPIEVVHSLHNHLVHHSKRENLRDLEEALDAEHERKQGLRIPENARFPEHYYYTEVPKFTSQIKRYFDFFGRDQVQVVLFDKFITDTLDVYEKTLSFLGVDTNFKPDLEVKNQSKQVRCQTLENIEKSELLVTISRHLLPSKIINPLKKKVRNWNYKNEKKQLKKEIEERLKDEFASEVRRLSNILDRDLMHWIN